MTTNAVHEWLDGMVEGLAHLGHPAIKERFILRNGKGSTGVEAKSGRGPKGQCFANAARLHWKSGARYFEGYAMTPGLFPLHHAWVEIDGKIADPTWDNSDDVIYFGVAFDNEVVSRVTMESGVFGLLDQGEGINIKLMLELDPGLGEFMPEGLEEKYGT